MSFEEKNKPLTSSYMMKFKEYVTRFVSISNIELSEDWGWFVDIESNYKHIVSIPLNNKYPIHKKHIYIPETIKEMPSMRSFKSMHNLHDETKICKIDKPLEKVYNHKRVNYVLHSFCILGIMGLFYGCIIL